jgi:hypothetical protein
LNLRIKRIHRRLKNAQLNRAAGLAINAHDDRPNQECQYEDNDTCGYNRVRNHAREIRYAAVKPFPSKPTLASSLTGIRRGASRLSGRGCCGNLMSHFQNSEAFDAVR